MDLKQPIERKIKEGIENVNFHGISIHTVRAPGHCRRHFGPYVLSRKDAGALTEMGRILAIFFAHQETQPRVCQRHYIFCTL